MESLFSRLSSKVVFVAVYIEEAHASDEWPVGQTISFCKQPKILGDRCQLAAKFCQKREYHVPMMVDTMENAFQKAFAAWPFRFYVINEGVIVHRADPHPVRLTYNINDLNGVLDALL